MLKRPKVACFHSFCGPRGLQSSSPTQYQIMIPPNPVTFQGEAPRPNIIPEAMEQSQRLSPHRDDICFMAKELDIRRFGSQGQQRTAALSLKLSEIELVKQAARDTPVLLLDDVLSELDKHRQNYLLDSINDIQTLITCTGVEDFVNHRFSINKVFHVHNGQVTNEN